jgi:hypothetical protein
LKWTDVSEASIDKTALGQVFLPVLPVYSVYIIPPWLSILIYHMGDEQVAGWWPQFRDFVSLCEISGCNGGEYEV